MPVMMETAVSPYQKNGDRGPGYIEEAQLELVHVIDLAAKYQNQTQLGRLGTGLPPVYWVEYCCFRMLLEMHLLDFLPAYHDATASCESDISPNIIYVPPIN
jgi:hypothetical protein